MSRKTIACITVLLIVLQVHSQQRLTLSEAINIALKNSYDIQLIKNNVDIASINNNIGVAGGLPTVSGTASDQESVVNIFQKQNSGTDIQRNGAASNNLTGNITASLLLYNGYRVLATKNRLAELQKQSQQQLNGQIQNTVSEVMVKYFDIIRQYSYLKTIAQNIEVSKKKFEIIKTRKEVGLANNADVFQAQIDLNTNQQDYTAQKLVIDQAIVDLLNLLTLQPNTPIVLSDTITVDKNIQLDSILNFVVQNPDIQSAEEQIHINQLIEKETAAQRYPSIRATSGLNLSRNQSAAGQLLLNQSYGPFVGITVSVPIYNGGTIKRQQQTAALNTKNAKIQKQSLELSYQSSIVKTFQSYTNSLEQWHTQQNTYQIAQQLVNLALERFQLGQATIIEVREAQKSFEAAAYRLVNLSYAAKTAEIELKRISSKLSF